MPTLKDILNRPVGETGERLTRFFFSASWVLAALAVFLFLAAPVRAAEVHSCDDETTPDQFGYTGYQDIHSLSLSDTITDVGFYVLCAAGTDCTTQADLGTGNMSAYTSGLSEIGTFCVYPDQTVTAGTWGLLYAFYVDGSSCTGESAGDSLNLGTSGTYYLRMANESSPATGSYTSVVAGSETDVCANEFEKNHAPDDLFYYLYDSSPLDPRDAPTVTVVNPTGTYSSAVAGPTYRLYTNVLSSLYPSEDPEFDVLLEQYDPVGADWDTVGSWSENYSDGHGLLINNGTGLAYGLGAIPTDPYIPYAFPVAGTYRLSARADFGSGYGDWSSTSSFTVAAIPFGGGGGVSWGGDDGGSDEFDDWYDDAVTASPVPTCTLLSWTASQTGECLWTWIKWLLVPPADGFFNYVEKPLTVLSEKWPFVYVTGLVGAWTEGWSAPASCPMPSLGLVNYDGTSVPEVDLCESWDGIADWVEGTTTEDYLVIVIWIGLGIAIVRRARDFLLS